jgi:threonine dehydratase
MEITPPALSAIREARRRLGGRVLQTPVARWQSFDQEALLGAETEVYVKLELFQHGGSFKPRGALCALLDLDAAALARGVTAVSAGNHAIAVAYAARALGTTAKVVMPASANPERQRRCRNLGAELVLASDVAAAFAETERIQAEEGRHFIHPFEGPLTALGTATLGLEMGRQLPPLDAVILPVGGGGLAAGVASALRQLWPACRFFGVEPFGADTMHRSFASGRPERIEAVRSIADSLGAPFALPYSFALCRQHLEEIVRVDDDQLRAAMRLMLADLKLAAEPACAASLAGLLFPLRERLRGKKVGIIACGSNLDAATFVRLLEGS